MLLVIVISCLISVVAGYIVKQHLDRIKEVKRITTLEFWLTTAITVSLVVPGITIYAWKSARNERVTFNEFQNGWETQAVWDKVVCERDGWCAHEYDCDPYTVTVSYSCNCNDKGQCDTCYRDETHYHSCPYCTEEWNFYVNTTLGRYTIADNQLPTNPNQHRWRSGKSVPASIPSGIPPIWAAANDRLRMGSAGPVTRVSEYTNYILRAKNSLLREYADNISHYDSLRLLPAPIKEPNIFEFYRANKIHWIDVRVANPIQWSTRLEYLNAELGYRFQGDSRLIVVNAKRIPNPNEYALTLKAYWQSEIHDKYMIAKNEVIWIVGVENDTVKWARGFTGMPSGNELMIQRGQSQLEHRPFIIDSVLGYVNVENRRVIVRGGIAELMLAQSDTRFQRSNMDTYKYLLNEIDLTTGQKVGIFVIVLLVSLAVWIVPIMIGDNYEDIYNFSSYRR